MVVVEISLYSIPAFLYLVPAVQRSENLLGLRHQLQHWREQQSSELSFRLRHRQ